MRRYGWLAAVAAAGILAWLLPFADVDRIGTDVLIRTSFWSAVAFIVLYTMLAPWWRNPVGRMFVILDGGVALALLGDVLLTDFHRHISAATDLRITVFALAVISGSILSRAWLVGQLHGWKFRFPWQHPRPDGHARAQQAGEAAHD